MQGKQPFLLIDKSIKLWLTLPVFFENVFSPPIVKKCNILYISIIFNILQTILN